MSKLELRENLKKYSNPDTCPIRNVVARVSGKWSMLILCILADNDTTRFSEIRKALPDISPKVLSTTLKNLEEVGYISRQIYAEIPPRVEYSLTELGKDLMPHLWDLIEWAVANFDKITKHKELAFRTP